MVRDNDYYSILIPNDGLIHDYELGLRLHSFDVMDDLLHYITNQTLVFGVLNRMEADL